MSDKKRTSITVDQEVYEFLQQGQINQSGLINELVKRYQANKDRDVAALKEQRRQLLEDAEDYEELAETKRQQAENIAALIQEAKESKHAGLNKASEALENVPKEIGNPAIERWAEKLGMAQQELVNELE